MPGLTSETMEESNPTGGPQPPWNSIPKFVPGSTNVQEYVQKLKFLASLWPKEHLEQLAPRAALLVEGSAFKKVARLDPEKLRVKNLTGIALLVEAIGGSWGSTELEERYEFFEKSLYGTIQRADESHDSYLSRMEANFEELIARQTKLEEVQAYVLLRQSTLPPEDKKRILLENSAKLEYKPVVKSFRLLGSKFFNEFQSGKVSNKNKVYDVNMVEPPGLDMPSSSMEVPSERAFHALAEEGELDLEPEFVEAMAAQEDVDALTVSAFESELEEFLQETPEMYDAMVTYLEARTRLQEKRRTRGFWPIKGGGRSSKSFKGRGKGKKGGKESLLQRIARSRCKICDEVGHWKAECPKRKDQGAHDSANVAIATGPLEAFMEETAEPYVSEVTEIEPVDEDVHSHDMLSTERNPGFEHALVVFSISSRDRTQALSQRMLRFVHGFQNRSHPHTEKRNNDHKLESNNPGLDNCPEVRPTKHDESNPTAIARKRTEPSKDARIPMFRFARRDHVTQKGSIDGAFVTSDHTGTHAILDTGASRCIIGEKTLEAVKALLPQHVQDKLKKTKSQVKFRFGNNQFLTSEYRIHFPLQREESKPLWLAVEVVPGATPFLFSKRAFKALGGILNTTNDTCILQKMSQFEIPLTVGPTDLYLIDVASLCQPCLEHDSSFHKEDHHAYVGESLHQGEFDDNGDKRGDIGNKIPNDNVISAGNPAHQKPLSAAESSTKSCDHDPSLIKVGFSRHAGLRRFVEVHRRGHHTDSHVAASNHDQSIGTAQHRERSQCPGESRNEPAIGSNDDRTAESKDSSGGIDSRSTSSGWESPDSGGYDNIPTTSSCQQITTYGGTFNTPKFKLDVSRRGGGGSHVGSRSRIFGPEPRRSFGSKSAFIACSCVEQPKSEPSSKSTTGYHCDGSRITDVSRMGAEDHHVGKETSWQELCYGHGGRPKLSCLVSSQVQLSESRDAGFRSLWPDVSSSQSLGDPTFLAELKTTREFLSKSKKSFLHRSKKFSHQICQKLLKAEGVLDHAFVSHVRDDPKASSLLLLEVYAGNHSPITDAVNRLGHKAMRFTFQDGDLSTINGRQRLWNTIEKYQPEHIWMAPECGPWGGWNRLNMSKSSELYQKISQKQFEQLPHVRLCSQICVYQHKRRRHFHLEQPGSSNMVYLPEFRDISEVAQKATLDMCRFGLRIPKTCRFIKKSSQVWTTSQAVFHRLHQQRCEGQHEHQRIEGSLNIDGQNQRISKFCATYSRGFAAAVARVICNAWHHPVSSPANAFVQHDAEDERPPKRFRFSFDPNKRHKSEPSEREPETVSTMGPRAEDSGIVPPDVEAKSDEDSSWPRIFDLASQLAPRVGNQNVDKDSDVFRMFQRLVPNLKLESLFVCRGTERLQVPLQAPASNEFPLRKTVSLHRQNAEVCETPIENWHNLTRLRRIRNHVPSKLTLTAFGSEPESATVRLPEARDDVPDEREPPSATRAMPSDFGVSNRTPSEVLEGWAPPPVPLHGPLFRNLSAHEKQDLVKLHKNLGHPDPMKLSEHLKALGAQPHIIAAAREFVCDACVESTHTKHQRPAQIHDAREFNELVGIDGFYWTGRQGFQVHVFHCIDEASMFHLGRRLETRHTEHAIPVWTQMWHSWAGNPSSVYCDPAGEFRSDQWLDQLQSWGTLPRVSTEAWQKGRVERHGQIIKRMITRFDNEKTIENPQEFDNILQACFQAKNALMRHQGYSPEQIVLGKSARVPASLSSDEDAAPHSFALGEGLASERFRQQLEIRSRARQAFLLTDNDQAFRRALLRKSCPMRGPFQAGQIVMYWQKRSKANRQEAGRWHGPAKVISQEGLSTVWISHADRMLRCSPESLRPASLREWNNMSNRDVSGTPAETPNPEDAELRELFGEPNRHQVDEHPFAEEYSPETMPPMTPQSTATPENQPESELGTDGLPNAETNGMPTAPLPPYEIPDPSLAPAEPPPLDLDPTDDELFTENVLFCDPIWCDHKPEDLFDWTVELLPNPQESILLAEDGLPIISEPLSCEPEQCFVLEIPLSRSDIIHWSQAEQPEELSFVASASKRARAEVHVKDLTSQEKALFDVAKDAELSCWIQTSALQPVLRRHLNPNQILKSRWVLTWKSVEDDQGNSNGRKAKARLVVLGFQDPNLTEVARDAPTLTKEGRHTILQMIASFQWELASFDIKTAFLRGKADERNPLAMEPPIELRKKLQLDDDQVCKLVGNAYGRVDAPLLFFKEFGKQLKELGFKVHPLEPCIHFLESIQNGRRFIHGILGTHVDDGLCGGDDWFHEQLNKLRQKLPFGSFKTRKFTFTGIQLEQFPDSCIKATQGEYLKAIPAIDIGKYRRETPEASVSDSEMTKLRGLIGSLQYAVSHTRPDLASRLGEIQTQLSNPTVQTLLQGNKVLREAQSTSDVSIFFRNIDPKELTHVAFGDASFASPKQLASFQGSIICATSPKLLKNEKAPVSPLTWSSKKINRVVRSTLSAEAFSMSRSVDQLGWMRLLWGTIAIDNFDWRKPPEAFKLLPPAAIVTDCKSLYDLVSRTAIPSCEEYRTTLEVLLIRERCLEHCAFRWIPTSLQLTDALTKVMDPNLLRTVLATGMFQLHDEQASLDRNAQRKQAISWFRANHVNNKVSGV